MSKRKIYVYSNDTEVSLKTADLLRKKLEQSCFEVPSEYDEDAELIVVIGGDGAFLQAVHLFNFPHIPFIGINTGHLGFFQEINPEQLDEFIFNYKNNKYKLQSMTTVKGVLRLASGAGSSSADGEIASEINLKGLNEIVIRNDDMHSIHLNLSIGGSFIERFSGDGIIVSTAAGSTAYNYSLGGSIVDPRLQMLQVTPIAPMNTTAYRCFTSSILVPSDLDLSIMPEVGTKSVVIAVDGESRTYTNVKNIDICVSNTVVNLLRFEGYDFWNKVKTKFL
ncbi:MAG: NAD(+)/NADH kinase [Firmicutes bacterium]|nr:NAD(+)/NADH kinase [Bacillota bacterium]